jgi:hypothetical protein
MSLWGNLDNATGNQKPVFANTTNVQSNSTIHSTAANTNQYYGLMMGVSVAEEERSNTTAQHPAHAGWVSVKYGTGPITSITVSGGTGINASGNLIITDISAHGQGTTANISYTTANLQNTLETYSSNAQLNTFGTLTIVSGGSGYSNSSALRIVTNKTAIANGTFTAILGGRAGRIKTETIVAMGSITGDDPRDNVLFTSI